MTLELSQTVYVVSEENSTVDVCVELTGELDREVSAEVVILQDTAEGKVL